MNDSNFSHFFKKLSGFPPYPYQKRLAGGDEGRGADGHESYTNGVLRLLDHYGPFRLTFFEAIFLAANTRASIRATNSAQSEP